MFKRCTKGKYKKALLDMVSSHYYPCATCGYPVRKGWCCNYCNSESPDRLDKEVLKRLKQEP